MPLLDVLSDLASITTAVVAGGAAVVYWFRVCSQKKRLEQYLKAERQASPERKTHTVVHLMAQLGMTEAEVLHASFSSKHVICKTRKDYDTGLAAQLLFEHSDTPKN